MPGCYVFIVLDDYGVEIMAKRTLEEIQDYAIEFINEQYSTSIQSMDGLKSWVSKKQDFMLKIYFLNPETLDLLEEV
jgi:hypothetical protein